MNRINRMIDMYATIAFFKAVPCGPDVYFEEATDLADKMLVARRQLKTWIRISQAIRGWHP